MAPTSKTSSAPLASAFPAGSRPHSRAGEGIGDNESQSEILLDMQRVLELVASDLCLCPGRHRQGKTATAAPVKSPAGRLLTMI